MSMPLKQSADSIARRKFRRAAFCLGMLLVLAGVALSPELSRAAAPSSGKERLRRLIKLPTLSFQIGVAFDPLQGFDMLSERRAAPQELSDMLRSQNEVLQDPAKAYRLGSLYYACGDTARAAVCWRQSVELYRKQDAATSGNGALMAAYGEALASVGEGDEAERVLRNAVKNAPTEWRTHAGLAKFLGRAAMVGIAVPGQPHDTANPERTNAGPPEKLPADIAEKARKQVHEALEAWDAAVKLAPKEPSVFSGRATGKCTSGFVEAAIRFATGDEPDPSKVWTRAFDRAALVDLKEACRLNPSDFRAIGAAALFEVFCTAIERGMAQMEQIMDKSSWETLPENVRGSLRASLSSLEELGQSGESRSAAGALEVLGVLQYLIVHDERGAETSLRRAIRLDPKRELAWDTLTMLLAMSERFEDLRRVCEDWLKVQESPRTRVLLAKAYESLNQNDSLLETAEQAFRKFPEDPIANLALAAALMRTSSEEASLARAARCLGKAEDKISKNPTRDNIINILYLRGLFFGLTDQTEQARAVLRKILEAEKDNRRAKEALEAIDSLG